MSGACVVASGSDSTGKAGAACAYASARYGANTPRVANSSGLLGTYSAASGGAAAVRKAGCRPAAGSGASVGTMGGYKLLRSAARVNTAETTAQVRRVQRRSAVGTSRTCCCDVDARLACIRRNDGRHVRTALRGDGDEGHRGGRGHGRKVTRVRAGALREKELQSLVGRQCAHVCGSVPGPRRQAAQRVGVELPQR